MGSLRACVQRKLGGREEFLAQFVEMPVFTLQEALGFIPEPGLNCALE